MFTLLLLSIGASTGEAKQHAPTLGSAHYAKAIGGPHPGFGTVAPKLVDGNGDPGSVVHDVRWTHWGSADALGYGKGYVLALGGGYLPGLYPLQLRAADLGPCRRGGPAVYRQLWRREIWGPGKGWSSWSQWPDIEYPKPQLLC
jgi:hypothetical protein